MTNKILFSNNYVGLVTVGIYYTTTDPEFSYYQTSSDIEVGILTASQLNVTGDLTVDGSPVTGAISIKESGSLVSAAVTALDFYPGISVSVNSGIASIVGVGTTTVPLAGAAGENSQVQYNNNGIIGGATNLTYDDLNNRVGIGTVTPKHKLDVEGDIEFTAVNSSTPTGAKDVTFEYVNDTTLRIKMRGTDGVVRSTTLTLS